jgi:threonine aldolase
MTGAGTSHQVDLRSDTVTLPSPEMRAAMAAAVVGDDFYGEDPTVTELEGLAASRVGKEAALYVPSGTMANLLAHLGHSPGGSEVIGPEPAHSFTSEAGGPSRVAGMTVRTVPQRGGELDLERIRAMIRPVRSGLLTQPTGLLWVEQPTRGYVVALEQLAGLRALADEHKLPIHMDGARIFNAAVALGVTAAEIAGYVDTVMFCVSKGLAAPVGSLLAGPAPFIEAARLHRQMLGGGMRQAGIVAAAGVYALQHNVDRLAEDHENAHRLAGALAELPGVTISPWPVETNIFFAEVARDDLTAQELAQALRARGVLVNVPGAGRRSVRFVTHYGIESADVDAAVRVATEILRRPAAIAGGTA